MFFLIYIALKNRWVYSTADRTVYTDTVSGTANVTGDTFAEVTLMTCGNLVYPCRVCNQTTAHTDQVCVTVSQDTLSNLRVTDITHGDTWLVEFFSYGLCHVGTPSVREIICIDLVLDGTVKSAGNIKDINLFLKIIQVFQSILQCISAFHQLIRTETEHDREERSYLFSYFIDDHTAETGTVLNRSAELIGTLVCDRGEELTDQIGVSCMDLYCVKASCLCTFCSLTVFFYDVKDLIFGKRTRDLAAFFGWNVRCGNRLHVDPGRNSRSSGMVDLDRNLCSVSMNIFTEFEKTWQIVVMVDAQLCGSVGALRGIDACVLYDDETCATLCTLLIIIDMKKTHFAVLFTVVGAHRHHNNTVLDSHIFNG